MKSVIRLILIVGILSATGCGGNYPLSGKVTYAGKPLPSGEILLLPDPEGGNTGPGVSVTVEDGEYSTDPDRGHVGGKYIARISGSGPGTDSTATDAKIRRLFYNYQFRIELPASAAEHDFDIPVQPEMPSRPPEINRVNQK